jgi:hypothetical protein
MIRAYGPSCSQGRRTIKASSGVATVQLSQQRISIRCNSHQLRPTAVPDERNHDNKYNQWRSHGAIPQQRISIRCNSHQLQRTAVPDERKHDNKYNQWRNHGAIPLTADFHPL